MNEVKLSLLIPTLTKRTAFFKRLMDGYILPQVNGRTDVEVLFNYNEEMSIGAKRNEMLAQSAGEYIAFIDDDDRISMNYVKRLMQGIEHGVDCCSLNGIITTNGREPKIFRHSIQFTSMYEENHVYYRPPNHLNCVRRELAIQCPFPDWQRSEDSNYCFQLRDKGLLKTEFVIPEVIYYYDYISDKRY